MFHPKTAGRVSPDLPGPVISEHCIACGCLASISAPFHICVCVLSSSYKDMSHRGSGGQEPEMSSFCPQMAEAGQEDSRHLHPQRQDALGR